MRCLAVNLCIPTILAVLLAGCISAPQQQVEPAAAEVTPETTVVDVVVEQQRRLQARQRKIEQLLSLAEAALDQDRLMRPADDNAFMWYQQVLELDELNPPAHWGMRQITQRYLELAEQAFESARPSQAEYLLNSALQVAATPQQVELIRERYRDQLKDKIFALPVADLKGRNPEIQQRLADIANKAKQASSRLLIVARNDAEGRWIYQQMREAVDGYRLRGNIEVGQHPRIVLIDL